MRRHIEGVATVDTNGRTTLEVNTKLPPGQHRVVVMLDEPTVEPIDEFIARIALHGQLPPEGLLLRREEMYND